METKTKCIDKLILSPGITAVIGSGGKTTLLKKISEELPGTVLLTTSTHILPFEGVPLYTGSDLREIREHLCQDHILCTGTPISSAALKEASFADRPMRITGAYACDRNKLSAPGFTMKDLAGAADYVLVEADGSRHLPLKAHARHEPVIPEETGQILWVIGSAGFFHPAKEVMHRPELFCKKMQLSEEQAVTPELYGAFLLQEIAVLPGFRLLRSGSGSRFPQLTFLLNQHEDPDRIQNLQAFSAVLANASLSCNIFAADFTGGFPILCS